MAICFSGYAFLYSRIFSNIVLSTVAVMRGFNNDDLDKFEKATKNITSKYVKMPKNPLFKATLRLKPIMATLVISCLSYGAYRIYKYHKHRAQHYVDIYEWKQNVASDVRWADLSSKISKLNFTKNQQNATSEYEKKLRKQFPSIISKIRVKPQTKSEKNKEKQVTSFGISNPQQSQQQQQTPTCSHTQQLILTKEKKQKINLGPLKLHTKQYLTTITSNRQIIKKTYIIPITIFGFPLFQTKKQQVKKISKKNKIQDVVQQKNQFKFANQCQNVHYWNLLGMGYGGNEGQFDREEQGKIEGVQDQGDRGERQAYKGTSTSQQPSDKVVKKKKSKERVELLFECRQRIKKVEQDLLRQLQREIAKKWMDLANDSGHKKWGPPK